jgi:molybdenum cofactor synthesis domain-containing protein
MPLLPLDEARAHVIGKVCKLPPVTVPLDDALGCVTTAAIRAAAPVPPFANTAMDGYAVRAADVNGADASTPVRLDVVGTLPAGAAPNIEVKPGQAVRIMTGAALPPGADAVVMVEHTVTVADGGAVDVAESVDAGTNIRLAGSDLGAGDEVVGAGTELRPAHLGVLASVGHRSVEVVPRPRVGVLSTGDELVEPGRELGPGQIYDSNRRALRARLVEVGCEAIDLGLIPDDPAAIEAAISTGAETCDALLTSGGVSVGDFDHVKVVLDRLGDMRWMQIAIRPAKPFAFGVLLAGEHRAVPVFGLPGNPVSSLVSFELLALPALRRMAARVPEVVPPVRGIAGDDLRRRADGKTHFQRVVVGWDDGRLVARSAGGQGSHQLGAMARSNALAVLPDGVGVAAGEAVDLLLLADPATSGDTPLT